VSILAQDETIRVDPGRLEALYRQLGDANAEDVVCRAMEELAVKLARAERFYRAARNDELCKTVRTIAAISEQVGLQLLARVAEDVVCCAEIGDETALAAVLARLLRAGERSLTEIWETQGLSI